jgi:light-regulated signal transduction histidine kinase (bacteriophytochrome)
MKAHVEGGEPFDIEYRLRTKPGVPHWFRSRAKAFRTERTGPLRMVGTIIDIHPRKLAEAKIKQQAEELTAVNEELEQFAYAASHDLQEPLRNLMAYSRILHEDLGPNLSEDAVTDLHYIEDAARRMKALIEDLLTLSRAGRAALSTGPVDVEACVRKSLANLQQLVLEGDAQIRWGQLPTVPGDPTMLTQLYQNLISNALKFRGDQAPQVELTAEARNGHWVLGVHDNGIGLDPQYAEKIFSPFQRLHGMADYAGTGIGLAICRKTVERHGGKIWVESEPGRGAHFKFTLPARGPESEPSLLKEANEPRTRYA